MGQVRYVVVWLEASTPSDPSVKHCDRSSILPREIGMLARSCPPIDSSLAGMTTGFVEVSYTEYPTDPSVRMGIMFRSRVS